MGKPLTYRQETGSGVNATRAAGLLQSRSEAAMRVMRWFRDD